VAVCADAAPVIDAVARNAIARHLEIMMFLHCLEKQLCDGTLVPAAERQELSSRQSYRRCDCGYGGDIAPQAKVDSFSLLERKKRKRDRS
jgi:hypothetical protein